MKYDRYLILKFKIFKVHQWVRKSPKVRKKYETILNRTISNGHYQKIKLT
jgi:hypothetical protein